MVDWVAWLKAGLKKPGKTQRGLAKALNVEESAVSRLLAGHRRLNAKEIQPAADYLGEKPPAVNPSARDSSYRNHAEGAEETEQQQVEMDAITKLAIRQAIEKYDYKTILREVTAADDELQARRARP